MAMLRGNGTFCVFPVPGKSIHGHSESDLLAFETQLIRYVSYAEVSESSAVLNDLI